MNSTGNRAHATNENIPAADNMSQENDDSGDDVMDLISDKGEMPR